MPSTKRITLTATQLWRTLCVLDHTVKELKELTTDLGSDEGSDLANHFIARLGEVRSTLAQFEKHRTWAAIQSAREQFATTPTQGS